MDRKRREGNVQAHPKELREKERAEAKPRIVEEGAEAEGTCWATKRAFVCGTDAGGASTAGVTRVNGAFVARKAGSVGVSFGQGVNLAFRAWRKFSDADYELRPAAACAAVTCPNFRSVGRCRKTSPREFQ
ncbi:hypothetical protein MRX96_021238 [Rhipicephalus microplus]